MVLPENDPKRTRRCTCLRKCHGGTFVTPQTYSNHRKYREADGAQVQGELSLLRGEQPASVATHMDTDSDDGMGGGGASGGPPEDDRLAQRPGPLQDELLDLQPPQDSEPPAGVDNPPPAPRRDSPQSSRSSSRETSRSSSPSPGAPNPDFGSWDEPEREEDDELEDEDDDDDEFDTNAHRDGAEVDYDSLPTAKLPKLLLAQQMISAIRSATLEDDLGYGASQSLQNPSSDPPELDAKTRLSFQIFDALLGSSKETYAKVKFILETNDPPLELLSYHETKQALTSLTNIRPIKTDMCPKSCLAFTGPFADHEHCMRCGSPRYHATKRKKGQPVARKQFPTLPLGPQLQTLWRHPESARHMRFLEEKTASVSDALVRSNGVLSEYEDFYHSSDYLDLVRAGRVRPNDMFLIFSLDGAQLYRDKTSDCWFFIWVVLNLSPTLRYKKKYVIVGGFVPGPEKPVVLESFMLPGFRHFSALQQTGLPIFDGARGIETISRLWFVAGTSDTAAAPAISGLVGHSGSLGCRLYCGFRGRNKPKRGVYYPAALRPAGDNRGPDDADVASIGPPSLAVYMQNLKSLLEVRSISAHKKKQQLTGIVRPSICLGFQPHLSLPVPLCFTVDLMHLGALNLPRHLIDIWRGDGIPLNGPGGKPPFVVLDDEATWEVHGALVAAAQPYLPTSFGRVPRNPAEKLNSGYKAIEYLTYIWILGPALLRVVLPKPLWTHFCKLVLAVRIVHQRKILPHELQLAHAMLISWEKEFELLYYQRRLDLLQLVRPCVHAIVHVAQETVRRGPLALYAQWTLENTIGNLGREVRQPSNPFANLSERGLLRAQINALHLLDPTLDAPHSLPQGSEPLGNGFIMLRAHDKHPYHLTPPEYLAFASYLDKINQPVPPSISVRRWARLGLPNGLKARSAWKENARTVGGRNSRNVKFWSGNTIDFGEVQFYCFLDTNHSMDRRPVALISQYSLPEPTILQKSHGTLRVCRYYGAKNLVVIDAMSIESVVAMVPFPLRLDEEADLVTYARLAGTFFVGEKLSLEMAPIAEEEDDSDSE